MRVALDGLLPELQRLNPHVTGGRARPKASERNSEAFGADPQQPQ